MMSIIGGIAGLVQLVCAIIVLIKLFQEKGVLHGILGILSCFIYPFIWGWIHSGRLNIKNIMIAWSVLWVISMFTNGAAMSSALSGLSG